MTNTTQHHYHRIANVMRDKIISGEWQPCMMLPGRRALAQTFKVAINTIERAVILLVSEGLLQADDRRGTFVTGGTDLSDLPSSLQPAPVMDRTRQATIGILGALFPYGDSAAFETQLTNHILRGCEQTLSEYTEMTHNFVNLLQGEQRPEISIEQALDVLLSQNLDGIILMNEAAITPLLARVDPTRIPVITVNMTPTHFTIYEVSANDVAAGYLAVQHLILRGYRRITTFFPFDADWANARLSGISEAIYRTQVPDCIVTPFLSSTPLEPTFENQNNVGYTYAPALLETVAPGDAIIAANDSVAVGILRAAHELGRVPGRDFGLISFDDYPYARLQGITSLHPPLEAMGREAARMMVRALRGEAIPLHVSLAPYIMARTSTLRINPSEENISFAQATESHMAGTIKNLF